MSATWHKVRHEGEYGEAYASSNHHTLEPTFVFLSYAGSCKRVKSSTLYFHTDNIPSYTKMLGTFHN